MNEHQKNVILRKIQAIHDRTSWNFVLEKLNELLLEAELEFDRQEDLRNKNPKLYKEYQVEFNKWLNNN